MDDAENSEEFRAYRCSMQGSSARFVRSSVPDWIGVWLRDMQAIIGAICDISY